MVTLQTADNALKSFYLDAVTDALDKSSNPFLSMLKKSTNDVVGKDVRKVVRYGMNGGVIAGDEVDELPAAENNEYVQFVAPLKNLYGTIEISDKAIRASQNNEGAFVNLLNDEMDNMIKSAKVNFSRMLFGDGSGKLGTVKAVSTGNVITLDSVKKFFEGMRVYMFTGTTRVEEAPRKVLAVDRRNKTVKLSGSTLTTTILPVDSTLNAQSKLDRELTGLQAIFDKIGSSLYGVSRVNYPFLLPFRKDSVGNITENEIQSAIDEIEENSGSKVNFIICSWGVKRALINYYKQYSTVLATKELVGGFQALSFNGIPIVADRFCPEGTMYLLNSDDFSIHQLCDWQWLEGEDGKVLSKVPSKPVYSATLVKYAELMCARPCGQGVLTGITEY